MVYFGVVKPINEDIKERYCNDTPKLSDLIKKVNRFVANNDPYTLSYLESASKRYRDVKYGRDKWGEPFSESFIEATMPPFLFNEDTHRFEMTEKEADWIGTAIQEECEIGSFPERAFDIPTICDFNASKGVHSKKGMEECAMMWKRKIDKIIPEFAQFQVDIRYEY
ncbi:MAG: hypothetical protein GF350_05215 [Chitinivibrionales bacterium]|nr:hypothetical protein [Chitinivibrionales bacterium]